MLGIPLYVWVIGFLLLCPRLGRALDALLEPLTPEEQLARVRQGYDHIPGLDEQSGLSNERNRHAEKLAKIERAMR